MAGTYYMRAPSGHTYSLSREEIERLVGAPTDGNYTIGNAVTRKAVKVSNKRPLTQRDVERISND